MSYYKRNYPTTPATGAQGKKKWNGYRKGPTVAPGSLYRPLLNPSAEQAAIIDEVLTGTGSIMVDAFAGVGKTSVIVEAQHRLAKKSPGLTQCYIVFANRNKNEAIGKCPSNSVVQTAHAFGLSCIRQAFGKIEVDNEKTARISLALCGPDDDKAELRHWIERSISLGQDYLCETREDVYAMIERQGIETCGLSDSDFADKVLEGMAVSTKQTNIVSFSDMTYMPIKLNLTIPHFSILFADECQDLNPARIELLLRSIGSSGRGVFVGDEHQSIFAFTGADRHALSTLKSRMNAKTMPLHCTFRCSHAIVRAAQQFVPEYTAAPSNSEGEVVECTQEYMVSDDGAKPGDFVLSRTNVWCAKLAMRFLRAGKKCCIQGKDIGAGLLYMLKRSNAKTVPEFQSWLNDWTNAECERLSAKKRSTDYVTDRAETLEAFCEGLTDIADVRARISAMFDETESNETDRVTFSTCHKSKGLERNRVFLLRFSFTVRPKTEEDQTQETNILYVSYTRGKDSLFLVS